MARDEPRLFAVGDDRATRGPNRRALGRTITALERSGRLEAVDAAKVELARTLAATLDGAVADDDESRFVRSAVAARYQAALTWLFAAPTPDDVGDDLAQLLAALSTPLGDAGDPGSA